MMEKLFQITRQVNLVVDEYDGEILSNDKVDITILYRRRNTYTWHERSKNEKENNESQDKKEATTDGST